MYLKRVDIIGFKSFAHKTRLEFEKGMTAVVGPNGCGKSNISDAIRWVLGEQSAKALRGGKMEDVIFNGAESQKPLGMAEVSLTLADCEEALGMEYNEVTVSRRVFRSGDSEYRINKKRCRLKDIQRLFMDTGLGTNSYSIMEQGKIDQILSSRPEDRRSVFEAASGITKYKEDRKEALRKLERTTSNLEQVQNLMDEVKRRLNSLKRQANKAQRFQECKNRKDALDLFASRKKIQALDKHIHELQDHRSALQKEDERLRKEVDEQETETAQARDRLGELEKIISETMEACTRAKSECEQTAQQIAIHEERIQDMQQNALRDTRDTETARQSLEGNKQRQLELGQQLVLAEKEYKEKEQHYADAEKTLLEKTQELRAAQETVQKHRKHVQQLDEQLNRAQRTLSEEEQKDRQGLMRRDRLTGEAHDLKERLTQLLEHIEQYHTQILELKKQEGVHLEHLQHVRESQQQKKETIVLLRQEIRELVSRKSEISGHLKLLNKSIQEAEEFPGGARALLHDFQEAGFDARQIVGALARVIDAPDEYQGALQAVLRSWSDAIVIRKPEVLPALLSALKNRNAGSARLLSIPENPDLTRIPWEGTSLLTFAKPQEDTSRLAQHLLQNVYLVEALPETVSIPAGITLVTRDGQLIRGDGSAEIRMEEEDAFNPLAREHERRNLEKELNIVDEQLTRTQQKLADLEKDEHSIAETIEAHRTQLEGTRRELSRLSGELNSLEQQKNHNETRIQHVESELSTLNKQYEGADERLTKIKTQVENIREELTNARSQTDAQAETLQRLEVEHGSVNESTTNMRISMVEAEQKVRQIRIQLSPLKERQAELEAMIEERASDLDSYNQRLQYLQTSLQELKSKVAPLQKTHETHVEKLEHQKKDRASFVAKVEELNLHLKEKRKQIDIKGEQLHKIEVEIAEERLRKENVLERIEREYHLEEDALLAHPDPDWGEGNHPPPLDEIIKEVRDLCDRMEKMGPVNLVAIEEYAEQEERYQFMLNQKEDLEKAQENLVDMIRKINETSTRMFLETFNKVDEHFQRLFKRLFGKGASAHLQLMDEEDILESGIDIIARPPGKKLQTVSLLSGGERTMTAVALLFALYSVKPSPFCVLDELDAALDDANIGRFVDVVKAFVEGSQFIVITHNKRTINAADILYGVTMPRKGISEIVSVKLSSFNDKENDLPEAKANAEVTESAS